MQAPNEALGFPRLCGAGVVLSWPGPSLAMLLAHLLCTGYGLLSHSGFSLSLGVENAPVKLVPRHLSGLHISLCYLLALGLCFLHSLWLATGSFFLPPPLFFFSGLHLWHMEVLRLGVELGLQLPAWTTATALPDQIQAKSVTYTPAHSNAGSLTH